MCAGHEKEFTVAILKKKDLPDVIRVWKAAGLCIRPEGRDNLPELERQIGEKNVFFLGAYARGDSSLIGVALITHDSRKGWINRLAVLPEYRRKGVASMLIRKAEQLLEDNGIYVWCAQIEEWNTASMELFRKNGYIEKRDIIYFTKRKSEDM